MNNHYVAKELFYFYLKETIDNKPTLDNFKPLKFLIYFNISIYC